MEKILREDAERIHDPVVRGMADWMRDRARYRVERNWVIIRRDANCSWCEKKIIRGSGALSWAFFEKGAENKFVSAGHFCQDCGSQHNIEKPLHLPDQGELFDKQKIEK